MSGVLQNIDPQPPLHPASVSSPRTKGGGYTLAGWWGGWGFNILEDARYWIGLLQYNLSTIVCICNTEEHAGRKLPWSGKSVIYSPANHWKASIMSPNRCRGERYRAKWRKERRWDMRGQRVSSLVWEWEFWARICKRLRSPGINSLQSILFWSLR